MDKSTNQNKPHFDLCFYHNINVKENVFFKARAEKGIGQHMDVSRMVWTLIDNSKLANCIAAIVVKKYDSNQQGLN